MDALDQLVPCTHGGSHEADFLRALADRRRLGYDVARSHYFCGRCRTKFPFMETLSGPVVHG